MRQAISFILLALVLCFKTKGESIHNLIPKLGYQLKNINNTQGPVTSPKNNELKSSGNKIQSRTFPYLESLITGSDPIASGIGDLNTDETFSVGYAKLAFAGLFGGGYPPIGFAGGFSHGYINPYTHRYYNPYVGGISPFTNNYFGHYPHHHGFHHHHYGSAFHPGYGGGIHF